MAANFSLDAGILRIQGVNLSSHPVFTCSNLTIETLEQDFKCLKLTIKIPERSRWCLSGVFIVNTEHISHLVLVLLLLTLSR